MEEAGSTHSTKQMIANETISTQDLTVTFASAHNTTDQTFAELERRLQRAHATIRTQHKALQDAKKTIEELRLRAETAESRADTVQEK